MLIFWTYSLETIYKRVLVVDVVLINLRKRLIGCLESLQHDFCKVRNLIGAFTMDVIN